MNDIFSITRFIKLIKNDILNYLSKYYTAIIIFASIMPVNIVLEYALGGKVLTPETRIDFLLGFLFIFLFIAPLIIYKNANDKKRGIDFTMLPASAFEKFLSMFLICSIILPTILIIVFTTVDTILTLLPIRYYNQYIFNSHFFSLDMLSDLGQIILLTSFSLCGNMLFRKMKMGKTILSAICLLIIVGIIVTSLTKRMIENIDYDSGSAITDSSQVYDNPNLINGEIEQKAEKTNDSGVTISGTIAINTKSEIGDNKRSVKISNNKDIEVIFIQSGYKNIITTLKILFYLFIASLYFITYWKIKKQQL